MKRADGEDQIRKPAQIELEQELLLKNEMLDSACDSIILHDFDGRPVYFNQAACDLYGYSREEFAGVNVFTLGVPGAKDSRQAGVNELKKTGHAVYEVTSRKGDGTKVRLEINARTIMRGGRKLVMSVGRDITTRKEMEVALQLANQELEDRVEERTAELNRSNCNLKREIERRKQVEQLLRESENRLTTVLESLPIGVAVIEAGRHLVVDANRAALHMLRIKKEDLIGRPCYGLICHRNDRFCPVTDGSFKFEHIDCSLSTGDGKRLSIIKSVIPVQLDEEELLVESFVDISERKQMEEQLRYLSLHDALTGLYNRAYFEEEMERLRRRAEKLPVGVIMCDLDGLKVVNDTLGHGTGDQLLKTTAQILSGSFRVGDMVARIGGDEFAILLPGAGRNETDGARRRILTAINKYNSRMPDLMISLSIGFAVGDSTDEIKTAFKDADDNMYQEKMLHHRSARSSIVQTLMQALDARDFITEGHAERLEVMAAKLASYMDLPENKIAGLRILAQFHDIGKVGIPDNILFKPGPLTSEEKAKMQKHCEIGYRIARSAFILFDIADLILKHHEWWDGSGYPLGLKDGEIPLECRIISIVDAYDAMTSDRPYRKAMSHEKALSELQRCAGTQFDPELVARFVELFSKPATSGQSHNDR